ncbi:hypothetical protein D9758_014510 [Tetrapyrgos nigripes]|uniref:Nephrocystin 3-like N-terminal domain-containing protein n=1 Tax=Tetrapyrgos nigripes TaxID=182062 RepID=A0A8H5FS16_9AGAR|nr:hypothetical protein D9758_014510 [Tetrapyrgos nigripes]
MDISKLLNPRELEVGPMDISRLLNPSELEVGPPGGGNPMAGNREISNFHGNTFTAVGHDQNIQNHYGPQIVQNINYAQQISQDIRQNDLIRNMPRAKNALYDANDGKGQTRNACTEGTRTEILSAIVNWAMGNSRIQTLGYWICGMAGTGKSTIAIDHSLIIPTIAYQLAYHLQAFGEALVEILRKEPDLFSKPPSIQLDLLLINPWIKIARTNMQTVVVVIDALDECENISSVLSALIPAIHNQMMPGLKFLFTSRPEGYIQNHLRIDRPLSYGSQVDGIFLHNVEESVVKADIMKFISQEFKELMIAEKDTYIKELAERSGKLFIYAATMVRFILAFPGLVRSRLIEVLSQTTSGKHQTQILDDLYRKYIQELQGHTSSVESVAFSPDDTKLASGSWDHTIRLWDVATGTQIMEPLQGHTNAVGSVAFSCDGTKLASGSWDCTLRLWDVATGTQITNPLQGHTHDVCQVAFSPDGIKLASGSWDKTLRLWDVATGTQITEPLQGHTHPVSLVAFSPDGTKLTSGSGDDTLRLWDVTTGVQITELLHGHENWMGTMAFSPDHTKLALVGRDSVIKLWDVATGTQMTAALHSHTAGVTSLAFSPDGTKLASSSFDKTLRLWDVATDTQITELLQGHTNSVTSVAFSPDGTKLASGSLDHTLRLWDVATGAQITEPLQGHTNLVSSVAFSPDGTKLASGSHDYTLRLWDVATGTQITDPLHGHTNRLTSVVFSPDGAMLASGSEDMTLRIWDVATGTQMTESLQGHEDEVTSVVFSPNGTKLALMAPSWLQALLIRL